MGSLIKGFFWSEIWGLIGRSLVNDFVSECIMQDIVSLQTFKELLNLINC